MKKKILITTGGSGGHTIPATILFDHLKKNFEVFLETDKRGASFIDSKKYCTRGSHRLCNFCNIRRIWFHNNIIINGNFFIIFIYDF